MEEFFKTDLAVLYKGDAAELEKLGRGIADMVLTDSPYGISYVTGHRVSASSVVKTNERFDKIAGDDGFKATMLKNSIWGMYTLLKPDTAMYMFTRFDVMCRLKLLIEECFEVRNLITWGKNNWTAGDLKGNYAFQTEHLFYCTKGDHKLRGERSTNLMTFKRVAGQKLVHPAQKPIELLCKIITKSSDEGQVVLDPFCGSGSTLIAATIMKRRSIGVDIDESNLEIAKKRLQSTSPMMFPEVEMADGDFTPQQTE